MNYDNFEKFRNVINTLEIKLTTYERQTIPQLEAKAKELETRNGQLMNELKDSKIRIQELESKKNV